MLHKACLVLISVFSACFIACQATDYKEQIGPYEIKFWLPDWIHPEINKTIRDGETYSGIPYTEYDLDIETGSEEVDVRITHYAEDVSMDLDERCEGVKKLMENAGCVCDPARRVIDNRPGAVVHCDCPQASGNTTFFVYPLDRRTLCGGYLVNVDWNTVAAPFLRSLNVTGVGA